MSATRDIRVPGDNGGFLLISQEDEIATVTINRPESQNAINLAMWEAFDGLMTALDNDDSVSVVIFRGPIGGPFSAGADIREFATIRSSSGDASHYDETLASGERAVMDFSKPTIAMIEGFAIGGGLQIALACDLRVCDSKSRFGITPSKLGIVYPYQSTRRLINAVGSPWASWLLMTGELIDAPTALRIGLVHEVSEDLEVRTRQLAATLTSRARVSLLGAKSLIAKADLGLTSEDDEIQAHYRRSLQSREYEEGVNAFLAKRAPDFKTAREPNP